MADAHQQITVLLLGGLGVNETATRGVALADMATEKLRR
jgi:hypothetical protein